ncbi:MAG: hypothetical protein ABEJ79_05225 [Halolamina sp.]
MWLDSFRSRTAWTAHANAREYDAPVDPWRLVRVDPDAVERFSVVSLLWGLGRVRGGDWDRPENTRALGETSLFEGLRQRYVEGRAWPETDHYDEVVDRVADGERFHGCESEAELREAYFPAVDELYESVRSEGYRPNRGAVYGDPSEVERVHDLEPLVLVGRDGEVLWSEGFHRLGVAQLLDVDRVPVYVLRRHAEWQAVRDAVAGGADPTGLGVDPDHPDLRDLHDPRDATG